MTFIKLIKMKYLLLIFLFVALSSFVGERFFHFTLSEKQANYHWQNLEQVKIILDQSTLPHIQVKQVLLVIDTLQKDLQIGLRIDSIDTRVITK